LVALIACLGLSDAANAAGTSSHLSAGHIGWGHGTVTSTPAGIDCGAICQATVTTGSSVTLMAVAAVDSTFSGWTGDCSGTSPTCTVVVGADTSAIANFTLVSPVTLTAATAGNGFIVSDPLVILCGNNSFFSCQGDVAIGSTVTLEAVPATGSSFSGWSGACADQPAICTLTMSEARSVTATFAPLVRIQVGTSGGGLGTVTSSPAAIDCGSTCRADLVNGTVLTLTATPEPGSIFAGWSGACSGMSPTCTVSLVSQTDVDARFTPPPAHFRVTTAGSGSGTVKDEADGIDCGHDCDEDVPYLTEITLTPVAAQGSTFTGWAGACLGATTTTCTIAPFDGDVITAIFTADPPPASDPAPAPPPSSPDVSTSTPPASAHSGAGPAILVPQPVVRVSIAKARPAPRIRPKVGGRARLGSTLACARGTWKGSPTAYVFTWRRDGKVIGHSASHLVRPADRGHSLRCDVTAWNAGGVATAHSAAVHVPR
jgi:uncharacterized repeat protein (TIGR02543 family)